MDELQHWRLRLKLAETCDMEFQSLFAEIMVKTFPGFEAVSQNRDGGNDGWVPNHQEGYADYFQVYAPQYHRFSPDEAIKKMKEDAAKLAKNWSPVLRVRSYTFVVKCPADVTAYMHSQMDDVCHEHRFDWGEVKRGETLLEAQVRNADPELQKLWAGAPMSTTGRREDAQTVQQFLSDLAVPAEVVIRHIKLDLFLASRRDVEKLGSLAWQPRWKADNDAIAEVQSRLLDDCASLVGTIRQGMDKGVILVREHDADTLHPAMFGRRREPAATILARAGELADSIRSSLQFLRGFVRSAKLMPSRQGRWTL